jgi:hypothetical protein
LRGSEIFLYFCIENFTETTISMKNNVFLVITMLLMSTAARAQVTQFEIDATSNSIIRAVDDEYVLIYSERNSTNAWFLLYRDGNSTAQAFKVPLLTGMQIQVRDVRIFDGRTAYFCGTMELFGTTSGLVGCFDIQSLFSGTGTVSYEYPVWGSEWMYPTDLQRLDLFTDGGQVCMAMVGKCKYDPSNPQNGTTVVSATYNGSNWVMYTYCHKNETLRFTDIACLDHAVMAVGHGLDDSSCYVKTFRPTTNFPGSPYVNGVVHQINYGSASGDVRCTRFADDTVLLAVFDDLFGVRTALHKVEVDNTGRPFLTGTWITHPSTAQPYGSGWRQRELAASDYGVVWLLQQAAYPGVADSTLTDWVLRMSIPGSAPTNLIDTWHPIHNVNLSMDLNTAGTAPWTSLDGIRLRTHGTLWPASGSNCHTHADQQVIRKSATMEDFGIAEGMEYYLFPSLMFAPLVFEINTTVICTRNNENE